jgi:putative ABC transport system permease protein
MVVSTPEIQIALQNMARNRLTSGLTMLGICFGVGAYICSVAIGEGAARQIQEQISNLGENMIWVEAGGRNINGLRTGSHGTTSLTVGDLNAIRQQVPLIASISPNVDGRGQIIFGNQNWTTRVRGVTPEYLAIRRQPLGEGDGFTEDDVKRSAKVCLLGTTIVRQLFGTQDPVGQIVQINRLPCRVSGVLATKGFSANGQDQDDVIFMPYTTVQKKIMGVDWLDDIMCSAVSAAAIPAAEDEITALMRERHHITGDKEDDFNIRHPTTLLQADMDSQRTMTMLLAAIASVALIVGGVGVTNIMLASVTGRTREIGIRRAVGARSRDILVQFLVEAVVLSLIGGSFGILIGVAGAREISQFAGWTTLIRPAAIVVAVGFACAVGICFGAYPAFLASRLDPVRALERAG